MVVPNHHDSNALKPLLKENVIRELLEITTPVSRRVIMLLFWMKKDFINCFVQLGPKAVRKVF